MKKFFSFIKAIILITIVFGVLIFIDNFTFQVNYYDFSNYAPESLKGSVMVQISDLHNESFGRSNSFMIQEIEKINPDYVFFTGDMVSAEDRDFSGIYSLAEAVGNKYKCFFIIGNHELALPESKYDELVKNLEEYGVTFLDNKKIDLTEDVCLYGLDYKEKYYIRKDYNEQDMENDLGKADKAKYNILITHNPNDFDTYTSWGADVVFTGHTHGGMVRMFDVGIISTDRTLFPQYDGGIYTNEEGVMLNSRGLSRGHIGIRLFNRPELVVVNF